MTSWSLPIGWCIALTTGLITGPVSAQSLATPAPTPRDQVTISNALQDAQGRVAVNQTAGLGNVQANQMVIGNSASQARSGQYTEYFPHSKDASARIDGDALARSQGAVSVNQSVGVGNAQLNLLLIGSAAPQLALVQQVTAIDDATLASVGASMPSTVTAPAGRREAVIGASAFAGSQGVLQVSQSVGKGNASVNAIVLQLPGPAL